MAGYEKRGQEEDILEIVRKKLNKIRGRPLKRKETKPRKDFERLSIPMRESAEEPENRPNQFSKSLGEPDMSPRQFSKSLGEPEISQDISASEPLEEHELAPKEFSKSLGELEISQDISASEPLEEHELALNPSGKPSEEHKLIPRAIDESEEEPDLMSRPISKSLKGNELSQHVSISEPFGELGNVPRPIGEQGLTKKRSRLPKGVVVFFIIVLLLAVLTVAFILFWNHRDSDGKTRKLYTNEYLESAVVINEQSAYLILSEDSDIDKISEVSIVFSSSDNSEYLYNPLFISREYEINASELDLESFKDITVAMASFQYKPSSTGGNRTAEPLGSAASLGPFVSFWKWVEGLF